MKENKFGPSTEAKYYYDSYGIMVVSCPKCQEYIPNVQLEEVVKCPKCSWEFKVVE